MRPRPGPAPGAMRPVWTALWLCVALPLGLDLVGPLAVGWASARAPIYVSSWAVRVSQGYQEAERLARKFGFVNLGQVGGTRMDRRGRGLDSPRPQTPIDVRAPPEISGTSSSPLPRPTSDSRTPRKPLKPQLGHLVGVGCKKMGLVPVLRGLHQGSRVVAMQLPPTFPDIS